MSIKELESAISQLPREQFAEFASWFDEYRAELWDRQIETDIKAGRLDELAGQADAEFEAGKCKPL